MGKATVFLLLLFFISPAVYAQTSHRVGGSSGWDTSGNYVEWAKGQTFNIGDSLVFSYGFTHTVDEVTEADYTSCNSGSPISSVSSSPTTIPLSDAGTRYFICGTSNHCSQGMKLAVTVASGSTSPGTPPPSGGGGGGSAPEPPSSGGATPSPPATTKPSSPPPPRGSNTASSLGAGMVGLSLVLGAMLGLMG